MKSFRAQPVIIEEAGQLDEPNSLNAFVRSYTSLRKVIWSGDPDQLPPTLLSYGLNEAALYRNTSQMERLTKTGVEVIPLDIQFRMDPQIAKFVSSEFYGSQITDHSSVFNRPGSLTFRNWVKDYAAKHGQPIENPASSFFISVNNTKVYRRTHATSPYNPAYIERTHDVVKHLLAHISGAVGRTDLRGLVHIAVACYYTEELALLKKWFHDLENLADIVDVVTIDSTQGWEWDVVVLSTTRPGGPFGLGFVADRKRQNVGLSRAKYGQVTIGHKDMGNPYGATVGTRGTRGGTGFTSWQSYWRYHFEELQCYLEVEGSFTHAAQALNVNPANYEEATGGRGRPTRVASGTTEWLCNMSSVAWR